MRARFGFLCAIIMLVGVSFGVAGPVMAIDPQDVTPDAFENQPLRFDCSDPAINSITQDVQQGGVFTGVSKMCIQCGACELCDFVNVGYQIARMIFGIMGAVAFAFILYGGVLFVISGGSAEMIEKGKTTLRNAIIGVFIIAFAWQIVHVALILIGTPTAGTGARVIFNFQWDKPPCTATETGPYQDSQIKSFEETQDAATGQDRPADK